MSTTDALRWLAFEARRCRDRDSHEALCLAVPWAIAAFNLPPMDETEAAAFKQRLREVMQNAKFKMKKAA